MTLIKTNDIIQSVADALQYISCYHSPDFIQGLHRAYEVEESSAAKNAIAQILINSRMSAEGRRPICQDTGIICAFVKVGMDVQFDRTDLSITEIISEGVKIAYTNTDNPLRASVVMDPLGARTNTKDNTPATVHVDLVPGNTIDIQIAAKGGGSEFKSKFTVLNPSDNLADWVVDMVPKMGAGWCPPGMLGIGVGGTAEKAMVLAKESLMEPIDMPELIKRGPQNRIEELRLEIYNRVNSLGIGAQGLGGLTTVMDVKIYDYPTHAATLPVAMIPNCVSTRHVHFTLDGSGAAEFSAPKLEDWPKIAVGSQSDAKRVNINNITREERQQWKAGDILLLSGKILTGRDAAHKRIQTYLAEGKELPVEFKDRFIYYVGPVSATKDEVVGPAGPTTATRMDKFTEMVLSELDVMGMIGKAERGDDTIERIKKHKSVYLIAVGGAAYLIAKSIKKAEVLGFEDLGMEAIYEFEIEDMPVMVAVDSDGNSVHKQGPQLWQGKFKQVPISLT